MSTSSRSNFSYDAFQTGDVLLFHGDGVPSRVIQWLSDCPYSHSGMVVRRPDGIYCWQSYQPTGGVELIPIDDFLLEYQRYDHATKPDAWVRHLTVDRTPTMLARLDELMATLLHPKRPFPTMKQFLENVAEGRELGINCGDGNFFCSQLLARTYQTIGLLDTKHPPNWFEPASFSTRYKLELKLGASLGPEIQIPLVPGGATHA